MQKEPTRLITVGVIAEILGVSRIRVQRILDSRPHIKHAALAGNTRLFTSDAVAQIRHEITSIDARRKEVGHD